MDKKISSRIKGYVAFIDILGFSNLISRNDFSALLKSYQTEINRVTSGKEKQGLQYVVFSDSILMYTQDDKRESLLAIIKACSELFSSFLIMTLPLRGSISYGTFEKYETQKGVILAGSPIIEAYNFEKMQNWIGIMLSPSVNREVPVIRPRTDIRKRDENGIKRIIENLPWPMLVHGHPIPIHQTSPLDNDKYDALVVVPTERDYIASEMSPKNKINRHIEGLRSSIQLLETLKLSSPDIKSQNKCKNTIELLLLLNENWNFILRKVQKST